MKQKPVALWEDSQYSLNLVRSTFTDRFGLIISSKPMNAEAELALAEALKLDKERWPKKGSRASEKANR